MLLEIYSRYTTMSETTEKCDRDPVQASTNGSNELLPVLVADKTVENGSSDKDSSSCAGRMKQYFEVVVVCTVIVVVWVLLSLPTIFYHLPQDSPKDVCIPENYTGSICRDVLQTRQSCLLERKAIDDIFISADPTSSQSAKEEEVTLFNGSFSFLDPSPECMEAVVPFLCSYIFPLCDSSGRLHQPSAVECREITDEICAQEYNTVTAESLAGDGQLPQCQLLPETTLECNVSTLDEQEDQSMLVMINTPHNDSDQDRICSEGFYIDESTGLCMPECGVWEEFPHSLVVGVDAVVIFSAIVYLLSGVAVLVLSCINYKRMFSFPSVFVVYRVIGFGVLEVLLLIGYTDRTSLFCSSRNLLLSVAKETRFCTLQGLGFQYVALVFQIFWLFHVVILFWRIMFPFHARHYETKGYFRYIHIAMIIAAIILPWESMGAILGTGGLTVPRFPPVACFAMEADATFYSFVLPISIICALGVSLITIILWVLIKVGTVKTQPSKNGGIGQTKMKRVTVAELKILIVFFYSLIFSVVSLTGFTVATQNVTEFASELSAYFACESQGIQPGRMCERGFNRIGNEVVLCLVYILLGFYPVVSLVFVISYQEMKEKFSKWFARNGGGSSSGDIPGTA